MAVITLPVDRAVPGTLRYQMYANADQSSLELEFDFEKDLGRMGKSGYILNNDGTNAITLHLNYGRDIDGSMKGIVLAASGTFSFDIFEIPLANLKITAANAIDVDIFMT